EPRGRLSRRARRRRPDLLRRDGRAAGHGGRGRPDRGGARAPGADRDPRRPHPGRPHGADLPRPALDPEHAGAAPPGASLQGHPRRPRRLRRALPTVPRRRVGVGARTRRLAAWSDRHAHTLLIAPAVVAVAAVGLYPLGYSLYASLVREISFPHSGWVG